MTLKELLLYIFPSAIFYKRKTSVSIILPRKYCKQANDFQHFFMYPKKYRFFDMPVSSATEALSRIVVVSYFPRVSTQTGKRSPDKLGRSPDKLGRINNIYPYFLFNINQSKKIKAKILSGLEKIPDLSSYTPPNYVVPASKNYFIRDVPKPSNITPYGNHIPYEMFPDT